MFNLSNVTDVEKLTNSAVKVLSSSQHILGKNVSDFEKKFANYIGVNECAGVANGSDALVIALRALGVSQGDKVATVANAGFYTCAALNPEIFELDSTTFKAKVKQQPSEITDSIIDTVASCPVQAITIVEEN